MQNFLQIQRTSKMTSFTNKPKTHTQITSKNPQKINKTCENFNQNVITQQNIVKLRASLSPFIPPVKFYNLHNSTSFNPSKKKTPTTLPQKIIFQVKLFKSVKFSRKLFLFQTTALLQECCCRRSRIVSGIEFQFVVSCHHYWCRKPRSFTPG